MSAAESLINAVLEDNEKDALKALELGAPPNTEMPKEKWPFSGQGNTVLHYAARHSSVTMVKTLLEKGADAIVMNQYKRQPIHMAAEGGKVESLRALLQCPSRVDVNSKTSAGTTALHTCARSGNSRIAQELLLAGADINAQDHNGCTALHHALAHGSINLIKTLIKNDADMLIKDRSHQSSRELARELGYDLAEIVDPNSDIKVLQPVELIKAVYYKNGPTTEACLSNNASPNTLVPLCLLSPCNSTLLHLAAFKGYEGITEILLKHGADRSRKNSKGETALMVAKNRKKVEVVECLRKETLPDYKNNSSPRGIVFVLNNKFSGRESRSGAQKDDSTILTLFESMNYEVRLLEDLNKEDTFAKLEHLSSDSALENIHSMFFFLLSHGKNDNMLSIDNEEMAVSEMMEKFKGNRCKTMEGKPQIWFCNFCRGEKKELETDSMSAEKFPTSLDLSFSGGPSCIGFRDTLVIYPIQKDFKALRDPNKGTVGVTNFCEAIRENMEKDIKVIIDYYQEMMKPYTTPHVENFAFTRRFFLNK